MSVEGSLLDGLSSSDESISEDGRYSDIFQMDDDYGERMILLDVFAALKFCVGLSAAAELKT